MAEMVEMAAAEICIAFRDAAPRCGHGAKLGRFHIIFPTTRGAFRPENDPSDSNNIQPTSLKRQSSSNTRKRGGNSSEQADIFPHWFTDSEMKWNQNRNCNSPTMTRANRLAAKERHEEEVRDGMGEWLGRGVVRRGRSSRSDGGVQAIRRLEPNRPPMSLDPPAMIYSPLSRHLRAKMWPSLSFA